MHGADGYDALGFTGTPGIMRSPDMEMFELSTPHLMRVLRVPAGLGRRGRAGAAATAPARAGASTARASAASRSATTSRPRAPTPAAGPVRRRARRAQRAAAALPGRHERDWGSKEIVHDIPVGHRLRSRSTAAAAGYGDPHGATPSWCSPRCATGCSPRQGARDYGVARQRRRLRRDRRGRDGARLREAEARMSYRVGIDVGGTFTDFLVHRPDGRRIVHKTSSTPDDPSRGFVTRPGGDRRAARARPSRSSSAGSRLIVHGTTVTTNAVLTRRGAQHRRCSRRGLPRRARACATALREDAVRQPPARRPSRSSPRYLRPRHRRSASTGRRGGHAALDEATCAPPARRLRAEGVEAVAISFMHSPAERRARAARARPLPRAAARGLPDRVARSAAAGPLLRPRPRRRC